MSPFSRKCDPAIVKGERLDFKAALFLKFYNRFLRIEDPCLTDLRRQIQRATIFQGSCPGGIATRDLSIQEAGINTRIYHPAPGTILPVLIYYHGGGWVRGSIRTHDAICRRLASKTPCVVVSPDYRLAPENRFPAAVEDAYATFSWVRENAGAIGGDPSRIAVAGDSSGGNLAAVTAIIARDRRDQALRHQVLFYPVTDLDATGYDSFRKFAKGYMLERGTMEFFLECYLPGEADASSPHASPIKAEDLSGLPSATIITAEFDVLRDQAHAYAARLIEAGIPTDCRCFPGMVHGFISLGGIFPQADKAIDLASSNLSQAFCD